MKENEGIERHQCDPGDVSDVGLPRFGVAGWAGTRTTGTTQDSHVGGRIVQESVGMFHTSSVGTFIEVGSTRQDPTDPDAFERLRDWTPRNPIWGYVKDNAQTDDWDSEVESIQQEIDQGLRRWETVSILVGHLPVEFSVMIFGLGYWAGIGRYGDVDITIDSRGVPLEGLVLVRLTESEVLLGDAEH